MVGHRPPRRRSSARRPNGSAAWAATSSPGFAGSTSSRRWPVRLAHGAAGRFSLRRGVKTDRGEKWRSRCTARARRPSRRHPRWRWRSAVEVRDELQPAPESPTGVGVEKKSPQITRRFKLRLSSSSLNSGSPLRHFPRGAILHVAMCSSSIAISGRSCRPSWGRGAAGMPRSKDPGGDHVSPGSSPLHRLRRSAATGRCPETTPWDPVPEVAFHLSSVALEHAAASKRAARTSLRPPDPLDDRRRLRPALHVSCTSSRLRGP